MQELETRCSQLEGRDAQYRASMRKKDSDYAKLQDSLRRAAQKEHRVGSKGMETTFELPPIPRTGGSLGSPLGGFMAQQAKRRAEELEKENGALRSMLVELQVISRGFCRCGDEGGRGGVERPSQSAP